MASQTSEELTIQINAEILACVRAIAQEEGLQLQALIEEAFSNLIKKRKSARPRPHVMAAYLASHEEYGELYKKLAQ